jgi:hypothetical protein
MYFVAGIAGALGFVYLDQAVLAWSVFVAGSIWQICAWSVKANTDLKRR